MPEPKRSEMEFRPDPRPRKRDKGPDVWGALERRIYREGDDPPYRFVGARTGIYDPEAKLPGQDKGAAFNADDDADKATPEAREAAQEAMTVVPVPPVEYLPDRTEPFPEGGDAEATIDKSLALADALIKRAREL